MEEECKIELTTMYEEHFIDIHGTKEQILELIKYWYNRNELFKEGIDMLVKRNKIDK
ncbi:MAG: hypothetical protein ACRC0V_01635 [Fusobacteriaceae bacterium]